MSDQTEPGSTSPSDPPTPSGDGVPPDDGGPMTWGGCLTDTPDREDTGQALAASLARSRRILDIVPVAILELDWSTARAQRGEPPGETTADGRHAPTLDPTPRTADPARRLLHTMLVRDANAHASRSVGVRAPGPLTGPLAAALNTTAGHRCLVEALAAWNGGERSWSAELTVADPTGRATRQVLDLSFPAPNDPAGQVFAVLTDVTEPEHALAEMKRRQVELEKLIAQRATELADAHRRVDGSQAFLRAITDNIPGLVGYWGMDQICRFANRAHLEWFGRHPDEVLGHSLIELLGPELYARNEPFIVAALGGTPERFERTLVKPTGEIGHMLVHYAPHVADGQQQGIFVTVTDITPIKIAQEQLGAVNDQLLAERDRADAARRQFEKLFELAPDAVLLVDQDGLVVRANVAAGTIFAAPPLSLIGREIEDFVPSGQRSAHRAYREAYQANPGGHPMGTVGMFMAVRDDGSRFQAHVSLAPLSDGEAPLMIAAVRDVSELTHAHQQLELSNSVLEQTTLAQQQFIHIASHDLREPINTIGGYSRLLMEDHAAQLDDTGRHYLSNIVESAERMRLLLDDLLAYVRLDRVQMTPERVSLDEVVAGVLQDLSAVLQHRGAEVISEPLPEVVGQRSLLRALVQNLVDNATKFHHEGCPAVVQLSTVHSGDEVEIVVKDNGIGVAEEHLDRMFEIFKRLQPRRYAGTGIGLAICRRIVQIHQGRIWAESTPGSGTSVHVILPVVPTGQSRGTHE